MSKKNSIIHREIPKIQLFGFPNLDGGDEKKLEDFRYFLYLNISRGIIHSHTHNLKEACCFELDGYHAYYTIPAEEFPDAIKKAIDYYLKYEDYEKCSTLRDILNDLENQKEDTNV